MSATRAAADGGLLVLATTDIESEGGASLRGDKDVVLAKYDSTGRQIWSRSLGVAGSADGYALAAGADGSVTVTGAVRGAVGETIDRGGADGFVARFDSDGVEQWLHRLGGVSDDSVDAVSVAADGTVYLAGRTRSSRIVVRIPRRRLTPFKPAAFINRSTRLRPTKIPLSASSA